MMKPLRKRHLQIWMTWAVLLPAGIAMAWLVIPNQQPVKLLKGANPGLLPVLVQSSDRKNYWVNIRTNKENTKWQMEWINKYELMVPSAVIYHKLGDGDDITKNELVGRIEAKGSYVFALQENPAGEKFILYDFIHEKILDSVVFKIPDQGVKII